MWMQIGILLTLVTGFAIGLLVGRISKREEYIFGARAPRFHEPHIDEESTDTD